MSETDASSESRLPDRFSFVNLLFSFLFLFFLKMRTRLLSASFLLFSYSLVCSKSPSRTIRCQFFLRSYRIVPRCQKIILSLAFSFLASGSEQTVAEMKKTGKINMRKKKETKREDLGSLREKGEKDHLRGE